MDLILHGSICGVLTKMEAMMNNHESLFDLWNFLELSEKQRLMLQFRKSQGNHYTKSEFLEFLAERYKGLKVTYKPVGSENINDEADA
jgi:hypothetical protein